MVLLSCSPGPDGPGEPRLAVSLKFLEFRKEGSAFLPTRQNVGRGILREKMKLREYIKMALLAVLFLISFVSGKTVQAADDSPYIVFENEPNNTPDLYVSKKVASDTTGSIPDATFRFSVKVNGSFYSNKTYRLIGPDGKELFQVLGPDGSIIETSDPDQNNTVEYTTDRNGEFTLKEGQTAWFQYVGNGAECVVSEVGYELPKDAEGSFTQTTPTGGVSWRSS